MKLSIILCGRNDNYAGNFLQRLEHNLNKLVDNIERMGLDDVEIIVTDWGSSDTERLYDVVKVPKKDYLKFLFVPLNLTKIYSPDSNFSIPHAMNAAVRRMSGEYMLSLDSDSYVPFEMFSGIYDLLKNDERDYIFYWGSRCLMPYNVQTKANSIVEMDNLIQRWKELGKPTENYGDQEEGWPYPKVNIANFVGQGCAILINKEILHESTFLYEKLNKWGWLDIEFHLRITSQYPCLGDLVDVTGSDFYHLGHHEIQAGFQVHGSNINSGAQKFSANGDDWGLGNENLKFNND